MYEVIFYTTEQGESPIDVFLDSLQKRPRAKIEAFIDLLSEYGHILRRPYIDNLGDDLWELRVSFSSIQFRLIYFYYQQEYIIILHGFVKTSRKIPDKDIRTSKLRMSDWLKRRGGEQN